MWVTPAAGMRSVTFVFHLILASGFDARHGRGTVRFGAAPVKGRWETKFLRRSRCYTTRLDEVLRVA